jgi:transposase
MEAIGVLTRKIQRLDKRIKRLCEEDFPETAAMVTVPGVAHVTALAYVTTLGSSDRFSNVRAAGAFVGLRPRRDQSGDTDRHLRITKEGNSYLRRLLVGSAQYILGPFGPDSDLRRWGLGLMGPGSQKGVKKSPAKKTAKKRAAVAVARKLAVVLLRLWKTGEVYRPFRHLANEAPKAA